MKKFIKKKPSQIISSSAEISESAGTATAALHDASKIQPRPTTTSSAVRRQSPGQNIENIIRQPASSSTPNVATLKYSETFNREVDKFAETIASLSRENAKMKELMKNVIQENTQLRVCWIIFNVSNHRR